MPIRCVNSNQENIFSFNFDDDTWNKLATENKSLKHLHMSCCDSKAILKRSKLGTKFFAHSKRGECTSAPESAEHLLGKQLIAEAVQTAGWTALTEERGVSPNSEQWIADVLAVQGNKKVAFEVQWSPQTMEETVRRQKIYKSSNVRSLWLIKQTELAVSKDLPMFRLRMDKEKNSFDVLIPSIFYSPNFLRNPKKYDDWHWQQKISIQDFIVGTLTGKLKFAAALGLMLPVEVNAVSVECWNSKCRQETTLVMSLVFKVSELLKNHRDISTDIYHFDSEKGLPTLNQLLPVEKLKEFGIGAIKQRKSKTAGEWYLSNGCFHCGAIQGRFFEHEYAYDQKPLFRTQILFDDSIVKIIKDEDDEDSSVYRWWFNEE